MFRFPFILCCADSRAGGACSGGRGTHPKWRRELPEGAGPQILVFASTPSSQRSWNHEAAALQRADREAVERLQAIARQREQAAAAPQPRTMAF